MMVVFGLRMAIERIPVKGDLLQLDDLFYEVEKVLFNDDDIQASSIITREFRFEVRRIY